MILVTIDPRVLSKISLLCSTHSFSIFWETIISQKEQKTALCQISKNLWSKLGVTWPQICKESRRISKKGSLWRMKKGGLHTMLIWRWSTRRRTQGLSRTKVRGRGRLFTPILMRGGTSTTHRKIPRKTDLKSLLSFQREGRVKMHSTQQWSSRRSCEIKIHEGTHWLKNRGLGHKNVKRHSDRNLSQRQRIRSRISRRLLRNWSISLWILSQNTHEKSLQRKDKKTQRSENSLLLTALGLIPQFWTKIC